MGNATLNTVSRPLRPSMIPKVATWPLRPRALRSLKNSRQLEADSLSPAWNPRSNLWPVSVTPMATITGTGSTCPPTRISKVTPSTKRYVIDSVERSRVLHDSTAAISSLLALLTFVWESVQQMSLLEIIERLRVLISAKTIKVRSSLRASSCCLPQVMILVLKSIFRSLGTSTWTSLIPLRVN